MTVCVQRLKTGDYIVDGDCVLERKTLSDFARSLVDGRLFAQAHRLTRSADRRALVLEGHMTEFVQCGVSRESLLGAMVTLTLVYRLPVLRAWDATETANLLCYASRQLGRAADEIPLFHGRRPRQRRRQQLTVLQSLPGIGPKRAVQLLERFGSLALVFAASPQALAQTPGLGPGTVHAIHELVHSPLGTGTNGVAG